MPRLGIFSASKRGSASHAGRCGWNTDRVRRLGKWLTCTEWELAALAAVTRTEMRRYMKANKFPAPVALHFAIVESWYLTSVATLPQEPIVPVGLVV